jgi:hypothetical protein
MKIDLEKSFYFKNVKLYITPDYRTSEIKKKPSKKKKELKLPSLR